MTDREEADVVFPNGDPIERKKQLQGRGRKLPFKLTPREREVVLLIGRDLLSYKAAAKRLVNRNQSRFGREARSISWRSVERYATRIRDRVGSELTPTRALRELYLEHMPILEQPERPSA